MRITGILISQFYHMSFWYRNSWSSTEHETKWFVIRVTSHGCIVVSRCRLFLLFVQRRVQTNINGKTRRTFFPPDGVIMTISMQAFCFWSVWYSKLVSYEFIRWSESVVYSVTHFVNHPDIFKKECSIDVYTYTPRTHNTGSIDGDLSCICLQSKATNIE